MSDISTVGRPKVLDIQPRLHYVHMTLLDRITTSSIVDIDDNVVRFIELVIDLALSGTFPSIFEDTKTCNSFQT